MSFPEHYQHILDWVRATRFAEEQCLVVGVNGPQGSGKTTLTAWLCSELSRSGLRAVAISVDDFYLTRAEQIGLAEAHPQNPYWQQRGYPGTHDVELGKRVLEELRASGARKVLVPRYDKSAFSGQGDRAPREAWTEIRTPLDVIFLEGWMLGFCKQESSRILNPALAEVNDALPAYAAWHCQLQAFLQLVPRDYRYVLEWRVEAEEKMKAQGKPGMSKAEIQAYIEKFLPAYELYLPGLAAHPPEVPHLLRIEIGRDRLPASKLPV